MWRYQHYHWHKFHRYGGHRGFHPFMLVFPLLFLLVFGGVILKFLFWILPFLLVAWLISKAVRGFGGCGFSEDKHHGDKLKHEDLSDEKPKRQYVQTSDGDWVEII
jgi:hypothetical protein